MLKQSNNKLLFCFSVCVCVCTLISAESETRAASAGAHSDIRRLMAGGHLLPDRGTDAQTVADLKDSHAVVANDR